MEGRSGEGGGLSEAIEALGWRERGREKREKEDKVWWKGKGMLRAAGNTWSATSGSRKLFAFFPLHSDRPVNQYQCARLQRTLFSIRLTAMESVRLPSFYTTTSCENTWRANCQWRKSKAFIRRPGFAWLVVSAAGVVLYRI